MISSELLVAEPLPNSGYTWTLVSCWFGEMLNMAESLFGPRDCSYTLLGIEFGCDGPQIWYPRSGRHIIIQLSLQAAADMSQACS